LRDAFDEAEASLARTKSITVDKFERQTRILSQRKDEKSDGESGDESCQVIH